MTSTASTANRPVLRVWERDLLRRPLDRDPRVLPVLLSRRDPRERGHHPGELFLVGHEGGAVPGAEPVLDQGVDVDGHVEAVPLLLFRVEGLCVRMCAVWRVCVGGGCLGHFQL